MQEVQQATQDMASLKSKLEACREEKEQLEQEMRKLAPELQHHRDTLGNSSHEVQSCMPWSKSGSFSRGSGSA